MNWFKYVGRERERERKGGRERAGENAQSWEKMIITSWFNYIGGEGETGKGGEREGGTESTITGEDGHHQLV